MFTNLAIVRVPHIVVVFPIEDAAADLSTRSLLGLRLGDVFLN